MNSPTISAVFSLVYQEMPKQIRDSSLAGIGLMNKPHSRHSYIEDTLSCLHDLRMCFLRLVKEHASVQRSGFHARYYYNILTFKAFLGFQIEGKSLIDGETDARKFLKAQGMAFLK
jgi:hypothetical protein